MAQLLQPGTLARIHPRITSKRSEEPGVCQLQYFAGNKKTL